MFRNLPSTLVLSASMILASMAGAHAHDSAEGPHGGAVVDVAGHHVEFVSSPTEMTFILTAEADAPIASSGAKMKAIVQDSGKTAQIELTPVEPNKLVGKLAAPLSAGAKVVFTGELSDGHTLQAKFVTPK
jgi:methionine-rich copper-binding protein CopC